MNSASLVAIADDPQAGRDPLSTARQRSGAKAPARLRALAGPHTCAERQRSRGAPVGADPARGDRGDALASFADLARFSAALTAALAVGTPAVLLIGLVRFKAVNDNWGRSKGEALLRIVAQRLRSAVRDGDVVGRLGGEEFAVLLQQDIGVGAGAESLGARIVDLLGRPYLIEGRQLSISANVGVALAPRDGADAAALIQSADLALLNAAEAGRHGVCVFRPELGDRTQLRFHLEADLRRAIVLRQFELHFQPQLRFSDGHLVAFESLIRWRHPVHGLIPPVDFIPLAEEIGFIVPLGEWVLRNACLEAATWPSDITVAVNVSALQLKDGERLQRAVAAALAAAGLPAERLELEITESALAVNGGEAARVLHALRATGVRISMDDFGTGYSSLSQLRSFPFDKLKLDQSFVRNVSGNPEAAALVRAIASLGESLGMTTTAEGVETPEQARAVRDEGYTYMQGYLVSRPVPAGETASVISRLNAKASEGQP